MVFVGRITKDAVVNTLHDERKVVNFTVAINEYFKQDGKKEGKQVTTFINCSYWISDKVAKSLKKGSLVEVNGWIAANPYLATDGSPKASVNCHVNSVKVHAKAKSDGTTAAPEAGAPVDVTDDLPF